MHVSAGGQDAVVGVVARHAGGQLQRPREVLAQVTQSDGRDEPEAGTVGNGLRSLMFPGIRVSDVARFRRSPS